MPLSFPNSIGIYILFILIFEFSRLFLAKSKKKGLSSIFIYFWVIISLLVLDNFTNRAINQEISNLINCEILSVLLLVYITRFIKKNNKRDNEWIIPLVTISLFSHIIVLMISGESIYSTLTIASISIIIYIIYNSQIDLILRFLIPFIVISLLFYLSYLYDFSNILIYSFIVMFALNIAFYEYLHRILESYYHSLYLTIFRSKIKKNQTKKVLFWQTKLTITQLALEHDTENKKFSYDYYDSWIKDLLGTNESYALEIKCHNDFRFSFLLNSHSEKLAIRKGQTLKAQLQTQYRGLDADIEIIPMTRSELYNIKYNNIYEVKLPKPPYLDKIKIIQSFINAFKSTAEDICLYVIWKKAYRRRMIKIKEEAEVLEYRDEEERGNISSLWQDDLFQVRIFVSFKINRLEKGRKNIIEGIIDNIGLAGRNDKKTSKLKRTRKGAIIDIYKLNLFSGRYITSYLLDFDLAKELPVKKKLIYELQSFDLKSIKHGTSGIDIGKYLIDGVVSQKKAILPIKSLRSSVLLIGKPNQGKTYLIANILKHIKTHNPKIGVLIINLAKGDQEKLYPSDYCLKWGDERLHIPYAVFNENFYRCLMEISECLVNSLGLKNVVVNALYNTLELFYINKLRVPKHINHLFSELLRYLEKNPYDPRLQMRIVQAIKHRFPKLFTNPQIVKGTRVEGDKLPKWAEDVLFNGKKVMLDFSGCSLEAKRLLSTLVLQMFRASIPDKEAGELKRIIILDEAHVITSKPENVNPDDDIFIAMDSFRKIFSTFIREFRSKGTSLFLADQTAEGLYDSAINIPCLIFLFNQSLKSTQHFITDLKEQELITRLDKRECMLKEGSESFLFRTSDFIMKGKKELIFDYIFKKTQEDTEKEIKDKIEVI